MDTAIRLKTDHKEQQTEDKEEQMGEADQDKK